MDTVIERKLVDQQYKKDLIKAYKFIFNTNEGKKVLGDLAKRCYYNKTTFIENSNEFAFKEGMRNVYLIILKMLKEEEK